MWRGVMLACISTTEKLSEPEKTATLKHLTIVCQIYSEQILEGGDRIFG